MDHTSFVHSSAVDPPGGAIAHGAAVNRLDVDVFVSCLQPFWVFTGSGVDALSTVPFPSLSPSPHMPSGLRMRDFLSNPGLGVCFWKTQNFTEVEICRFL